VSPRGHVDSETEELVRLLRSGDERGWEIFLSRYRRLIYSAIHRVNGRYGAGWDEADMEDVFEDAVVKLLRNRGKALASWEGRCRFETWIYRIVRNVCIDRLRRSARRPEPTESDASHDLDRVSRDSFAGDRGRRDLRMSLEQAIRNVLTPREAIAVRLIYFEGFTYREVASRFGMSVGAMSGLVYRALAKLRADGGLGDGLEGS